ncbi:uncharacterized protein LOC111592963 isoform X2 [Drosophila hydei]|uniref:Uncharacterized protein LOC111592963 isoform X2 n=1 Tax=Drosophila hydei TaxID=7224 RepID=A0A6J1LDF1_DROHY|nr:uncharacterized protein LOC111592963 isoform X2 [Drosophila hydei]
MNINKKKRNLNVGRKNENNETQHNNKSNEYKDYALISKENWQIRESRHYQRIQDVKVCLSFIADSIDDYNKLQYNQSKEQAWQRYVDCDGLPRVSVPAEIRTMLSELRHYEALESRSTVNWELSVDERCVLSQNIYRKDLTRKTLMQTVRPNIGAFYDKAVANILITLERIVLMLHNEHDMRDIPSSRITEILALRPELSHEIYVFFDKLTYRIISAPTAYRTSFEGLTETYCYNCSNYNFQVWWLRDVPARFDYFELPLILAVLDCVGIQLQIPLSVLCDNLTLQCVHTFFDHLSEEAKSYDQAIDATANSINGGIMDIEDCLINEWLMQVNIVDKILTKLEFKKLEYEEYEEYLREMSQKDSNSRLDDKKRKSFKKSEIKTKRVDLPLLRRTLKQPASIPEGFFPDPFELFLEEEENELRDFLDRCLNPRNLNLTSDEINLRQYNILGGVYSMHFVRKPKNTGFEKFNVTLHEDGRILYTSEDVRAVVESPSMEHRSSEHMHHKSRFNYTQAMESPENIDLKLTPEELPYFCLTFRLPELLCLFGKPVACQFMEEVVEDDDDDISWIDFIDQHKLRKKLKKSSTKTSSLSKKSKISSRISGGFDAQPNRPDTTLIRRKTMNAMNIYRPSIISTFRMNAPPSSSPVGVYLTDFYVQGKPLTPLQVHELARYCLPRMLSSFKFPLDFRLEQTEEVEDKVERGCTLVRRQNIETKEPPAARTNVPEHFSFEMQADPERIFPIFDHREQVKCTSDRLAADSDTHGTGEHNKISICGLLNTLDGIEDQYASRCQALMSQTFGTRALRLAQSEIQNNLFNIRSKTGSRSSKLVAPSRSGRLFHMSHMTNETHINREHSSDTASISSNDSHHFRKPPKESVRQKKEPDKVKHWTTKYIKHTEFLPESCTFKIRTDRLGVFGFAYKCYEHFPFQDWTLKCNSENNNEIIFTLDTCHVRVILFITNAGIRGYATKITKEYVANPIKYVELKEPTSDFSKLRRRTMPASILKRVTSPKSIWQLRCMCTMPLPYTVR